MFYAAIKDQEFKRKIFENPNWSWNSPFILLQWSISYSNIPFLQKSIWYSQASVYRSMYLSCSLSVFPKALKYVFKIVLFNYFRIISCEMDFRNISTTKEEERSSPVNKKLLNDMPSERCHITLFEKEFYQKHFSNIFSPENILWNIASCVAKLCLNAEFMKL